MFNRPNNNDPAPVVADYIELQCLLKQTPVSSYTLRSLFSMSDDEIDNNGVESSDDRSVFAIEDGIKECKQRAASCPAKYPFTVNEDSLEPQADEGVHREIYQFLLLSTRLNMNERKVQAGHDATKLFEELCASVAGEYFGQHSKSFVFGTAGSGTFQEKIEHVIRSLHLVSAYKSPLGSTDRQKDAAVDVIAWIPFADNKDSQMIAIGQCKTGTHWESMLTSMQPNTFFGAYFAGDPFADVERMFFVTESCGMDKWEERSRKAGIMFDRTRIMEYAPANIDGMLLRRITEWNRAALASVQKDI